MRMRSLALLLGLALMLSGCANAKVTMNDCELRVLCGDPYVYQCESGEQIKVKYYSLSDSSLNFIKLTLPGESEITLPNAISASGARYSNESLQWWVKGRSGFVQVHGQDREWQLMYRNCHNIKTE